MMLDNNKAIKEDIVRLKDSLQRQQQQHPEDDEPQSSIENGGGGTDIDNHVVDTVEPLPSHRFADNHLQLESTTPGAYHADALGSGERARKVPFSLLVADQRGRLQHASPNPLSNYSLGESNDECSETHTEADFISSDALSCLTIANPVSDRRPVDLQKAEEYDPEATTGHSQQGKKRCTTSRVSSANPHQRWIFLGVALVVTVAFILCVLLFRRADQSENTVGFAAAGHNKTNTAPSRAPISLSMSDHLLNLLPHHTVHQILKYNTNLSSSSPQVMAYKWTLNDPFSSTYSDERLLQRFALGTLYYATDGHKWHSNSNWLSYSTHECDWFHKPEFALKGSLSRIYPGYLEGYEPPLQDHACLNGEYKNLWLDQNNLHGYLPPELYLLTSLQTLSIGLNALEGTLFSLIGQLTSLDGLAIYHVRNSGTIPTELGLLTNLRGIGLNDNQHTGTIPTELNQLTNLDTFIMSRNHKLQGTIPDNIAEFSALRWLVLDECNVTGTIPTQIGRLKSLEWLAVGNNQLSGTLPTEVGLLESILILSMHWNHLVGTLPSTELGELTTSTLLSFHNNPELSGTIPTQLGQLTNVRVLNVQNSSLSGTLPIELSNLPLEELSFLNNNLVGSIPSQYGLLTEMRRFTVGNNSLTGTIPDTLIGMQESGLLFSVNLGGNPLSGTIPNGLCKINASCIESNLNPCEGVVGLTFDCSSLLCGCDCPCD